MKAFNGFKAEANNNAGYDQLPPGPYIAKIMAVKIEGNEPDQSLILRLDIAEGPYVSYYAKRYDHDSKRKNSKYPAKYKGDFRLRIPNAANTKALYPESDLKRFNDAIYRIEESNPGYHWDWNEKGLAGLFVGISVQQGTYNGSQFTRIARLEIVNDIRQGNVGMMAPMEPRSDAYEPPVYQPPVDQQTGFQQVDVESLPF